MEPVIGLLLFKIQMLRVLGSRRKSPRLIPHVLLESGLAVMMYFLYQEPATSASGRRGQSRNSRFQADRFGAYMVVPLVTRTLWCVLVQAVRPKGVVFLHRQATSWLLPRMMWNGSG